MSCSSNTRSTRRNDKTKQKTHRKNMLWLVLIVKIWKLYKRKLSKEKLVSVLETHPFL